ncbi:MAG TPA: DUF4349 domain-containing protein, partial [Candidatus Angelobacter sp.]|nr:DUF4349 domain-containing protein [Candidatus Angelobacter sp.]
MAYLDGELATERAVEAAAHLERCDPCQELAAELRKMSQEMMVWEVEELEPAEEMPIAIRAALQDVPRKSKKTLKPRGWRVLLTRRGLAWAGGGTVFVLFLMAISVSRLRPEFQTADHGAVWPATPTPAATPQAYTYDSLDYLTTAPPRQAGKSQVAKTENGSLDNEAAGDEQGDGQKEGPPTVPMIARTAGLTLVAKDFDKTRTSVEEILKRHNGYIGELNVSAPSDAGRTLTATLRIPASQLEGSLAELKQLGRVENESQGGEEVTAQYV